MRPDGRRAQRAGRGRPPGRRTPPPGRGLSRTPERHGPDLVRTLDRLTMPRPNGRWAPRRRPSEASAAWCDAGPCPRLVVRGRAGLPTTHLRPLRTSRDRGPWCNTRRRRPVDHAQVAVVALVQDGDPFGLGVTNTKKRYPAPPSARRVLPEHWPDRKALHLDDPGPARRPFRAVSAGAGLFPARVGPEGAASPGGRPPAARPVDHAAERPGSSTRRRAAAGSRRSGG